MAAISHILAIINIHSELQTAARRAAELARKLDAKLSLGAVVYYPEAAFDLFHLVDRDNVRHQFMSDAQEKLKGIALQLGLDSDTVRTATSWLHPFDSGVLHCIGEVDPDLVVVAPRDSSSRRLSHAEWRLIHASPVPVLLARSRAWNDPAVIAACVDPGHHGDEDASVDQRILDFARIFHGRAGTLEVLHAVGETPDAIGVAQSPKDYMEGLKESREKKIRALLPEPVNRELAIKFIEAEPEDAINHFCINRPVDMLAMGVFSRSAISDFLIGGTARRVLPGLPCDVLAIPASMLKNREEARS